MKNKICGVIFFYLSLSSLGYGDIKMPPDDLKTFYRVQSPDLRVNDQPKYFSDEYQQIVERRRQKSIDSGNDIKKPVKLVGLGLSGGGIRSAAYQLGLLSGLQSSKTSNQVTTLLDNVDYLSCVSGGCWATGAFLIANETTEDFFNCLTEQASLIGGVKDTEKCGRAKNILRDKQSIDLVKTGKKKAWENEIKAAYFPEGCKDFKFSDPVPNKCRDNFKGKPNVIFNTTHSTESPTRFGADINNLPFQITPDQLGTIVDCGSSNLGEQECGVIKRNLAGRGKIGFFVRQDAKDFEWVERKRRVRHGLQLRTELGSQMSKAMAHSSAVVGTPTMLSFSMGLTYQKQKPADEIRDNYILADGGFVENLGLLSLVERGTELIVLSDMGYPERKGDDLKIAAEQVHKLLKCQITGIENINHKDMVSILGYTCDKVSEGKGTKKGTILYVRPYPDNINEFKSYLEKQTQLADLFTCINGKPHECYGKKPLIPDRNSKIDEDYSFPQTNTMLTSYDDRLIRAYYLLGKFIGENNVAPEMKKQLENQTR
jgi:hypothetical protein